MCCAAVVAVSIGGGCARLFDCVTCVVRPTSIVYIEAVLIDYVASNVGKAYCCAAEANSCHTHTLAGIQLEDPRSHNCLPNHSVLLVDGWNL